jgi:hypothetical protein
MPITKEFVESHLNVLIHILLLLEDSHERGDFSFDE